MFYDVFSEALVMVSLVSGAKIAEPPTHVNSNNAEISKKHPAHEPAGRNSLFFCNAPKNITLCTRQKPWPFQASPLRKHLYYSQKNITTFLPDRQ